MYLKKFMKISTLFCSTLAKNIHPRAYTLLPKLQLDLVSSWVNLLRRSRVN